MVSGPLRLVVLGATGFVGGALLRALAGLEPGACEVRALVRGRRRIDLPFVTCVEGELPDALPRALFPDGPYAVVHFGTKQVDADGTGFERVNVGGTLRLLEGLAPGCLGVIYGSSISVYGQGAQEGVAEDAPIRPETALARSRVGAEEHILAAMDASRASALLLRPRFVLGCGDRHTLPAFLGLARSGRLVGSGRQAYSVIDVDDYAAVIVRLTRRVVERALEGRPLRAPLHVAYERPLAFDEIARALGEAVPLPRARVRLPAPRLLLKVLRGLPSNRLRALVTRLELVGLPHHVSVAALSREIGREITAKDPREVVSRAARGLVETRPC